MYLSDAIYTDLPIIPLVHGGGVMMRLRSTVHECAVVLQHVVDIVEHDAVHRHEPLRSLDEANVHHSGFVEHRWRVLQKHLAVHVGCIGFIGCNSSMWFQILPESGPQGQPSIPPGSMNEYQLRLGRQRQVWFIPLADERGCAGKTVRSIENACYT